MKPTIIEISESFAKGDIPFMKEHLATDAKWNILGEEPIIGKDAILEVMQMSQLQSFPEVAIHNIISEKNFVVIESTGKGTTINNKPYNQTYCEIFTFESNELKEITTYLDTLLTKEARY